MATTEGTVTTLQAEQYYTPQEVAQRLGLARKTVYHMISSGKIHAVKLSRKAVRVSGLELLRLLSESGC